MEGPDTDEDQQLDLGTLTPVVCATWNLKILNIISPFNCYSSLPTH